MQALILVGGEGTRLRPLTSTTPKPVVTLVDRPFMGYMLEWLSRHGVDDVILSCGFKADRVRAVLGEAYGGIRLRYVEEPEPLGTGGALKYAEELLEERFFMLNGDVLTDIDLTAQLARHDSAGAQATLALVAVDDPSAYGLVRLNSEGAVRGFLEKPSPDQIDTDLINAGAYILQRSVLAAMPPAGTKVSIERDVFPRLVGHGLYGHPAAPDAYWMDIGTPQRYLQGTFDILEGRVETDIGRQVAAAGFILRPAAAEDGAHLAPPLFAAPSARVAAGARVGGRAVLGENVTVQAGVDLEDSVVLAGTTVEAGSRLRRAIIGPGCRIGADCRLEDVMLGEGVELGRENTLMAGARIFSKVRLPDRAISF